MENFARTGSVEMSGTHAGEFADLKVKQIRKVMM
ncbi:hypothetical protein X739_15050 [Mesorhizobium sp. LNHC220B00]|nr:hypothetical protein X739_15050 [Mesorhizobium sp. LNHC220B00]